MKLKILYTIPNFQTAGSSKVVFDLVCGIKEHCNVEVACFRKGGYLYDELIKMGIKIHQINFSIPGKPYHNLYFRLQPFISFLKSNNYDIVHSWHYLDDWTESLAVRFSKSKFVYTKKSMSWGGKDWWIRSKLANKVITINLDMNLEFFNGWKNIDYMPLGIDTDEYSVQKADYNVLSDFKVKQGDFVLVSVANLVPVKGIETAIKAVAKVNHKNLKYIIVGRYSDDYYDFLNDLILDLELSNNVFFTGEKSNIKPYLGVADAFVIPTKNEGRKEGLPIAPIEAMSSGVIVFGSNIPGVKDILMNHQELIFEPNDHEHLANILSKMINTPQNELEELKKRFRKEAIDRFGLDSFINGHLELYESLVRS